ncbi:MAG TPA: MOSC domain-containing protein [Baekduia sp.]|nr:MOSC domain-containing protein [Baekduia sp.]
MSARVVTRICCTPIKGLRVQEPSEILLDEGGAVGDREFLLVDNDNGVKSVTLVGGLLRMSADYDVDTKRLSVVCDDGRACDGIVELGDPLLVDYLGMKSIQTHEVHGPWSALISRMAGQPLRLAKVDTPGHGSDLAPVSLLGEGSLEELARRSGLGPIDARRFRMLLHFGPSTPHEEDDWNGQTISVGEVRMRVGGTIPRCAATTRDPEAGKRDSPIVKAIRDYRGVQPTGWGDGVPFGVYAEVVQGGRVRIGDPVEL